MEKTKKLRIFIVMHNIFFGPTRRQPNPSHIIITYYTIFRTCLRLRMSIKVFLLLILILTDY